MSSTTNQMAAFAAQIKLERLRRSNAAFADDRCATSKVFRAVTVAEASDAADTGCAAQEAQHVREEKTRLSILEYFGELIASWAAARPPPWHRRTPAAPQNAALHQTATPKVRAWEDKCLGIEFLGLHAPHRCALPHVSARRSTLDAVYRLTGLPVARGAARGSPCPRDIVDAPRSANFPRATASDEVKANGM